MDLTSILSQVAMQQLAKSVGTDSKAVESIAAKALPQLMSAMMNNASTAEGSASLLNAALSHADDTKDVDKIDAADGAKIIGHILGGNAQSVTSSLASAGVSQDQVSAILAKLAPMVLSSLGSSAKTAQKSQANAGAVDMTAILGALMGAGAAQPAQPAQDTKQAASNAGTIEMVGKILGKILK